MIVIKGASIFSIVIVLSFLIICGWPLGELTMGGQYKVFPKRLRINSKSKKEKYVMTPLSAISAVCFWIIAL